MPRKPPQVYAVHLAQDGAQVVAGVPLDVARGECARLNAEARVIVTSPALGRVGEPQSMYHGEVCRYEVRGVNGMVV